MLFVLHNFDWQWAVEASSTLEKSQRFSRCQMAFMKNHCSGFCGWNLKVLSLNIARHAGEKRTFCDKKRLVKQSETFSTLANLVATVVRCFNTLRKISLNFRDSKSVCRSCLGRDFPLERQIWHHSREHQSIMGLPFLTSFRFKHRKSFWSNLFGR